MQVQRRLTEDYRKKVGRLSEDENISDYDKENVQENILEADGKKIYYGRHSIQMPMKTAWLQMMNYLESIGRENDKNICLKYVKLNDYHYAWSISNKKEYSITPLSYYRDYREDLMTLLGNDSRNVTGSVLGNDIRNVQLPHNEKDSDNVREKVEEEDLEEF